MTKQDIVKQVNQAYAKKRADAQARALAVLQNVLRDKAFETLYYKKKQLEFDIAKREFLKEDCSSLKNTYLQTQKEIQTYLQKHHLSEKDFEPTYACPICQDTGRVNGNICACYKEAVRNALKKACIGNRNLAVFDDWREDVAANQEQRAELQKAKVYLQKLVHSYPKLPHKTWVFAGCTGVGKSFALECITSAFLNRGVDACIYTSFQINELFLKYHTTFTEEKEQYMNRLLEPSVLLIDDLGTEPMLNNVTINYLYLLLTERMSAGKTTFFTTNLSPNNILERYGERVFSRLCSTKDAKWFKFIGDDLRLSLTKKALKKE